MAWGPWPWGGGQHAVGEETPPWATAWLCPLQAVWLRPAPNLSVPWFPHYKISAPQGLTVAPGPLHSDSLPRVWVVGQPQALRTPPPSLGPKLSLNRCWNLQVSLTLLDKKVWGHTGSLFLIWGEGWRRLPDPRWPAIPALPALGWDSSGAPLDPILSSGCPCAWSVLSSALTSSHPAGYVVPRSGADGCLVRAGVSVQPLPRHLHSVFWNLGIFFIFL